MVLAARRISNRTVANNVSIVPIVGLDSVAKF